MAFEEMNFNDESYRASSNVSVLTWTGNPPVYASGGIQQYTVVTFDTTTGFAGDVKAASVTTVMPLGVAQDGPSVGPGQSVRIRTDGISKVIAGGVVNYGDLVMVNASGQVVTATATAATNFFTIGQCVSTTTAQAGDVVSVRLRIGSTQYVNA